MVFADALTLLRYYQECSQPKRRPTGKPLHLTASTVGAHVKRRCPLELAMLTSQAGHRRDALTEGMHVADGYKQHGVEWEAELQEVLKTHEEYSYDLFDLGSDDGLDHAQCLDMLLYLTRNPGRKGAVLWQYTLNPNNTELTLLTGVPAYQDDGWISFGRIHVDLIVIEPRGGTSIIRVGEAKAVARQRPEHRVQPEIARILIAELLDHRQRLLPPYTVRSEVWIQGEGGVPRGQPLNSEVWEPMVRHLIREEIPAILTRPSLAALDDFIQQGSSARLSADLPFHLDSRCSGCSWVDSCTDRVKQQQGLGALRIARDGQMLLESEICVHRQLPGTGGAQPCIQDLEGLVAQPPARFVAAVQGMNAAGKEWRKHLGLDADKAEDQAATWQLPGWKRSRPARGPPTAQHAAASAAGVALPLQEQSEPPAVGSLGSSQGQGVLRRATDWTASQEQAAMLAEEGGDQASRVPLQSSIAGLRLTATTGDAPSSGLQPGISLPKSARIIKAMEAQRTQKAVVTSERILSMPGSADVHLWVICTPEGKYGMHSFCLALLPTSQDLGELKRKYEQLPGCMRQALLERAIACELLVRGLKAITHRHSSQLGFRAQTNNLMPLRARPLGGFAPLQHNSEHNSQGPLPMHSLVSRQVSLVFHAATVRRQAIMRRRALHLEVDIQAGEVVELLYQKNMPVEGWAQVKACFTIINAQALQSLLAAGGDPFGCFALVPYTEHGVLDLIQNPGVDPEGRLAPGSGSTMLIMNHRDLHINKPSLQVHIRHAGHRALDIAIWQLAGPQRRVNTSGWRCVAPEAFAADPSVRTGVHVVVSTLYQATKTGMHGAMALVALEEVVDRLPLDSPLLFTLSEVHRMTDRVETPELVTQLAAALLPQLVGVRSRQDLRSRLCVVCAHNWQIVELQAKLQQTGVDAKLITITTVDKAQGGDWDKVMVLDAHSNTELRNEEAFLFRANRPLVQISRARYQMVYITCNSTQAPPMQALQTPASLDALGLRRKIIQACHPLGGRQLPGCVLQRLTDADLAAMLDTASTVEAAHAADTAGTAAIDSVMGESRQDGLAMEGYSEPLSASTARPSSSLGFPSPGASAMSGNSPAASPHRNGNGKRQLASTPRQLTALTGQAGAGAPRRSALRLKAGGAAHPACAPVEEDAAMFPVSPSSATGRQEATPCRPDPTTPSRRSASARPDSSRGTALAATSRLQGASAQSCTPRQRWGNGRLPTLRSQPEEGAVSAGPTRRRLFLGPTRSQNRSDVPMAGHLPAALPLVIEQSRITSDCSLPDVNPDWTPPAWKPRQDERAAADAGSPGASPAAGLQWSAWRCSRPKRFALHSPTGPDDGPPPASICLMSCASAASDTQASTGMQSSGEETRKGASEVQQSRASEGVSPTVDGSHGSGLDSDEESVAESPAPGPAPHR
ncbi:hypothetical protein WJX72_004777 [[Myrmecia] bisecta]|uniref:DNA2/NAM7 helicase-like C-terminal domain-containing protein n=1 Tax=[Myrmecia] bisecta TaxID=41462 RepID=A0AAW1QQJ6_9CHLO